MAVQPDSFTFGGVDMLDAYGIRCISYDVLLPKLRARKKKIPGRDGEYDFGAAYYEERAIKLDCQSMRGLSRQELREVAYLLTKKSQLVLWDEPDKYYVGRIYNETALKYIGMAGHDFTLPFVCEPFAYGETVAGPMQTKQSYKGTAPTPTRVAVKNNGNTTWQGLHLQIRVRSDG